MLSKYFDDELNFVQDISAYSLSACEACFKRRASHAPNALETIDNERAKRRSVQR
jgi:hypothetical protein